MKKHTEDWKQKYMRALADYQNLERRVKEEKEQVRAFAAEGIIAKLLPVVDTFTKVREHIKDAGVDLALRELTEVLNREGVAKIETKGKPFDPNSMECVEVVAGQNDAVVEEVLPGYTFRGKIVRVARVKVGKQ